MYNHGANAYQTTNITTTDPIKLILMLYDAAIKNLFLAKQGVKENDPVKRGEHLGKAISIITELLTAVQGDPDDETVSFLRGLYSSMLKELIKVNLSNDVKPIDLSIKYIAQLRNIWKEHVMNGEGQKNLDRKNSQGANLNLYDNRPVIGGHSANPGGLGHHQGYSSRG